MISDIGSQVADIARTQGDLNGLKAAKDKYGDIPANATEKDRQDYLAKLRATPEYKETQEKYGTGSDMQRGIQAATAALQGLAGGNIGGALAGASAPELAHLLKSTEDNPAINTIAHAILGGAVAVLQGNSAAAGAAGAATGELAAHAIASLLYPDVKDLSTLSEDQKQTVITLASVSAGMAGGLAGGSTASAAAGAQGGKNAAENNATSIPLPSGLDNYMNAVGSWNQYAENKGLSVEEKQAGLDKLAKGDLPEGANITKVIVEGYQDGVMIGAAWYLGPAASVGKVVGGGVIAEIANGGYQWFNLSQPGNENKSWDYKSSISAGVGGMLAPGRNTWQNIGIAMGGAFFTDGPNTGSLIGSALGSWAGGKLGELAPFPGEVNDLIGGLGGELIGDKVKDKVNGK
jgi:filamentous hemagglutinin